MYAGFKQSPDSQVNGVIEVRDRHDYAGAQHFMGHWDGMRHPVT
jgi:hypothetical protein